jgi:hypothetical protein
VHAGWIPRTNADLSSIAVHMAAYTIKAVDTFYGILPEEIAKPRWRTFAFQHQVVMWTSPDRETERQV